MEALAEEKPAEFEKKISYLPKFVDNGIRGGGCMNLFKALRSNGVFVHQWWGDLELHWSLLIIAHDATVLRTVLFLLSGVLLLFVSSRM
ncbi:Methyltransferase type [Quillaja saponaria]|uniref:Methyltransferase type n=1 Tax=Quillaja saponaria TaxID=32244 RepID=A0AAD7Q035_QUISA|nr:Methyltransferase type [Quillaja saponaria]